MQIALLIFFITACVVDSARILGVVHISAHSHYQLGNKLFKGLAARGHEVTLITPFTEKTPVKNFKQIILTEETEKMEAVKSNLFDQINVGIFEKVLWMESIGHAMVERTLSHANVKKLLKSEEKFDLVIIYQFMNEAFKGFCHHYNTPCVVLSPMAAPHWTDAQVGNPDSPAYVPDMYSDSSENNFMQRLLNSLFYVTTRLFNHFYGFPRQNELMQKYFPGAPNLNELYYNTSLILVNSHVSINSALPRVPNMIEIGGFHVNPPKELPKDLKEYLDDAKDGAIFFSMGSNLKSKDLPKETLAAILKAFSNIKQKVLWKWEDETLPGQPPNVKLSKWFPQQDILAHPNIKLFITHGGLLSTTEAIYHSVPIISIPVFADQGKNAAGAEKSGYGLTIPYKEFTGEKFSRALNEILSNPKYSENAKRRSEIMHDEPLKPLDKAIFWVEYVVRHQGAPHLRSAVLNLNWYQYLLLDVLTVVILVIFVPLFIVWKLIKKVCCKKNVTKKVTKNKKKN